MIKSIWNAKNILILLSSSVFLFSCTTEIEDVNDGEVLNSDNSLAATPVTGNVYTIKNLDSGRTLDMKGKSNSNGANLQLWGTNANTRSTHRQWEILSAGSGYVRLKGVDSGKSLEVSGGSNSNGANVQQWTYNSATHQQWEILPLGNGYFRLKNRDSGKSLRATGSSNGSNVDQYNYNGSDNQKWFFTQVGGNTQSPPSRPDTPTTPSEPDTDNGNNSSSNFISTRDGVFQLSDFVIESSSHNSSSSDRSTDSWNYNSSSLSSKWYNLSGGDYYLTSARYDGKRTEWKEDSGEENSLSVNQVMKYEASIDDIPENGVTIAQMHNRGGVRRPLLRVYIDGGRIRVKLTTNDLTNSSGTYSTANGPTISENSKFKVQMTTGSGKVNVKIETSSGTLDRDFSPNTGGNYNNYRNSFYYKAGVYTEGDDTEPTIRFYSFEKS